MEPDWQAFGRGEGGAMSDLIRLAEQLGCREALRALRREQAECLLHGLGAVLAAIEGLGGGHALARRDKGAALCLGRCLVEVAWGVGYGDVTDELRSRVVWAFRRLGPDMLPAAAAGLRSGAPGSEEHACAAARLTAALMGVDNSLDDNGPVEDWPDDWFEDWPNAERQAVIAADCIRLLQAAADALRDCCTGAAVCTQPAAAHRGVIGTPEQQDDCSLRLKTTAHSLLRCLHLSVTLYPDGVNQRQLLAAAGQLIQQLVACAEVEDAAAAAGLLPRLPESAGCTAVGVLRELQNVLRGAISTVEVSGATAGWPALHTAVVAALRTALDRVAQPQHIGLLLGLLLLAEDTLPEHVKTEAICSLVTQLSRLQRVAAAWLAADQQQLLRQEGSGWGGQQPFGPGLECFADQLVLLADVNAGFLSSMVMDLVERCTASSGDIEMDQTVPLETAEALVCFKLESLHKSRNLRQQCTGLGFADVPVRCCVAPGFTQLGNALLDVATAPCSQLLADPGTASHQAWASRLIICLATGGVRNWCLAQAEAARQASLAGGRPAALRAKAAEVPRALRGIGTTLLQLSAAYILPDQAHALARTQGAVPELLWALMLPGHLPPSQLADDPAWADTVRGMAAICDLLWKALGAHGPVRTALLLDGGWDEVVQSVRSLQPPAQHAAEWPEQRDAMLHKVSGVMAGCGRCSSCRAGGGAPAADADAAAAADRAMQELLAEEQPAEAPSQRSRAAAKRARKKVQDGRRLQLPTMPSLSCRNNGQQLPALWWQKLTGRAAC